MANKQIKLKHVKEASTLYHYTKCNGVNGILENNCFWATKSDFLNDPKEFSYIEAIIRDICKELIKNEDWRDSITMWSEFGNKTGYNIGFDGKKIIKRIEEDNIIEYHGFVLYEKAQQKEAIRKILNTDLPEELEMSFSNIIEAGAKNRNNEIYRKACRKFQKIAAVYAMFFKYNAFKEEEEYRFIFKKKAEVLYREKDGFLIPYIEIPLSNRLLPVKEIVIAPKNHIDLAKKGVEYMMKEKGYEVEIRLSDISLRY